uniref:EGF-like domain-containing protein n=1 Tax=Strongyloides venezuelensis TaxID=75913 RepID=A0A0K0F0N1_STRVS
MERTNILIKIFIALCFYDFLNNHLYGYKSIDYKLNVEYCIRKEKSNSNGKSKNKNQISESNIEKGLKMISERSCIVFLKKSSCEEKKKICKKECTEKSKKKKSKKNKKSKCTKKCEYVLVKKSSPFIKFSYDKNSHIRDYNFNGSVSLMRTVAFEMKINENCNKNPGCVARMVLMYLGLIPTVRRRDRDIFVSVDDTKIKNEYKQLYSVLPDVPLFVNYDFSSIAHYSQHYGESSNGTTFSLKTLHLATDALTGQEYRPAFSDLKWLYFAHCRKDLLYSIKCKNGGYPKSGNSSECECPTGFSGETCDKLEKSDNGCHESSISVKNTFTKIFEIKGQKNCTTILTSPAKTRIGIRIFELNCEEKMSCFENDCLQIKYEKDMALTGVCFCGTKIINVRVTSHSNQTVIRYTGSNSSSYARIGYYLSNDDYQRNEYDQEFCKEDL